RPRPGSEHYPVRTCGLDRLGSHLTIETDFGSMSIQLLSEIFDQVPERTAPGLFDQQPHLSTETISFLMQSHTMSTLGKDECGSHACRSATNHKPSSWFICLP